MTLSPVQPNRSMFVLLAICIYKSVAYCICVCGSPHPIAPTLTHCTTSTLSILNCWKIFNQNTQTGAIIFGSEQFREIKEETKIDIYKWFSATAVRKTIMSSVVCGWKPNKKKLVSNWNRWRKTKFFYCLLPVRSSLFNVSICECITLFSSAMWSISCDTTNATTTKEKNRRHQRKREDQDSKKKWTNCAYAK